MVRRILVSLGGPGYSTVAIRRAVELAQLHGAQLTAVTVSDVKRLRQVGPVPIGAGAAAHDLREYRLQVTDQGIEEAIEEFESICNTAGVQFRVQREQGDPFQLVPSCARYHDLTVLGLRSIFNYGILGDTDYRPCKVLTRLINGGAWPMIANPEHYHPIRRVLIAYSGSIDSARAMKRFVQLRLWPEMKLRIVTFQTSRERGKRFCEEAAEYCRDHGFEAEMRYRSGRAKTELLREADDWQADMIVLGSSTPGPLSRGAFGDTALHAIRQSERSLFLSQ